MELKSYKDFIIESKNDLWIFKGDFQVRESMVENGRFIKDKIPDIVNGYFNCADLELTTLEGSPKEVEGYFDCEFNKLTSLKGSPSIVGKGYNCRYNKLISLEGAPEEVRGYFNCEHNKLTSLKGSPEKISGDFNCSDNKLEILDFVKIECKSLICINNNLITLENLSIKADSYNFNKNKLTSLKGAPVYIHSIFCILNNNLESLEFFPKKTFIYYLSEEDFKTELIFVNSNKYKDNYRENINGKYWQNLLEYCLDNKLDILSVKGWPEDFKNENSNIFKSVKGLSKFNL